MTGLVDRATRVALDDALAARGESAAAEEQIEATAVQTMLKLTGYWPGPIDGERTPELEDALQEFQGVSAWNQRGRWTPRRWPRCRRR